MDVVTQRAFDYASFPLPFRDGTGRRRDSLHLSADRNAYFHRFIAVWAFGAEDRHDRSNDGGPFTSEGE